MLWHIMQLRPALASGLWMFCWMGVSIMPLKSRAGSWQPAHHFVCFTPSTSCMYSMLLRYQKVVGGDIVAVFGLDGTGEKFAVGAVAFLIHGGGSERGIVDAVGIFPGDGAGPPGADGNAGDQECERGEAEGSLEESGVEPITGGEPI